MNSLIEYLRPYFKTIIYETSTMVLIMNNFETAFILTKNQDGTYSLVGYNNKTEHNCRNVSYQEIINILCPDGFKIPQLTTDSFTAN